MTKKEYKKLRAELLMMDVSFKQIAKKFYTSRQMVQHALKGDRNSELCKEIRGYVYKLLGCEGEAHLKETITTDYKLHTTKDKYYGS